MAGLSEASRDGDEARASRHARGLMIAIVLYGFVLVPSILILDANPDAGWRYAVALVPMAPIVLVVRAVLAVVERLGEDKLATLDRRHFGVMRPAHVAALELVPEL